MTEQPLLSVIIVNYNGAEVIKDCLSSVINTIEAKQGKLEIVVVDNASQDASLNIISEFSDLKLAKSGVNLGFAGGCNLGLTYCSNTKFIYILNNDATVLEDTFSQAINYLEENENVGLVGSLILDENKPGYIDIAGSEMMFNGFLQHIGMSACISEFTLPEEFFTIKGAGFIFSREILDEVIYLFDDRYFAYLEETDFSWRIRLTGKKVILLPTSKIVHKGGHTSKRINYEIIEFHSFKNRTCNLIKNLGLLEAMIVLPLHFATLFFITLVFLFKGNMTMVSAILKSVVWNLFNINVSLNYRKRFMKNRKVSTMIAISWFKVPNIQKNFLALFSYIKYRDITK